MKKTLSTAALCALLAAFSSPNAATANEDIKDLGHYAVSIGSFDAFNDNNATDFRFEYHPNHSFWPEHEYLKNAKPWVGAQVTSDSSIWVGAGLLYDWHFAEKLHLTPSWGVGLYRQGDSSLDLGHAIEFRSQIELGYDLKNQDRIGVAISHMSNGGLDSHNPGVESLNLYYHFGL